MMERLGRKDADTVREEIKRFDAARQGNGVKYNSA
jgi:hypothetical protein